MEPKELPSFTIPLVLISYTQQLEILATALKVQTLVQLYVLKTEVQLMFTPAISNFYLHPDWRSLIFLT